MGIKAVRLNLTVSGKDAPRVFGRRCNAERIKEEVVDVCQQSVGLGQLCPALGSCRIHPRDQLVLAGCRKVID